MKSMKRWLGLALVFVFPLVSATIIKSEAADKIKFQLDWIIEGKHVPFFVAQDKGF
jgi:ABC-type nitrate/sulfonate/bicarbonate transport system substrate-binding protein